MSGPLAGLSTQIAAFSAKLALSPVGLFYMKVTGGTPFSVFLLDWAPLLAVVVLPVLCVLVALIGVRCTPATTSLGHRVARRVGIVVRADVRMYKSASKTNLSDGGKGSPIKNKNKDLKTEEAIKKKAEKGGRGGRFY